MHEQYEHNQRTNQSTTHFGSIIRTGYTYNNTKMFTQTSILLLMILFSVEMQYLREREKGMEQRGQRRGTRATGDFQCTIRYNFKLRV